MSFVSETILGSLRREGEGADGWVRGCWKGGRALW
uniref:Uncharacterized protein n=1 Tax=Arundo donax TaxID=35708 RepID=A0A0A9A125_ARUDO